MKQFITVLIGIIFFLSILQITLGLQRHLRTDLIDFTVYYNYTRILLSGKSPYFAENTLGVPFNYPPSFFLLFTPLSILPKIQSQTIFITFSLLFFIISANIFLKIFIKSKLIRLLILSFLLQNFPTKFTLVTGQINLIVVSLIFLALYFDIKRKQLLSGLFWGLSICLKLTPLPLFFYFLISKKWTSLVYGIITFIFLNFLILTISPENIRYFTTHLPSLFLASTTSGDLYDQSLRALLIRLNFPYPTQAAFLLIILMFLVSSWQYLRKKMNDLSYVSIILILSTIGSSFAWQHHFVFLFPGFIAATLPILSFLRKPVSEGRQKSITPTLRKNKFIIKGFFLLLAATLVAYHIKDISPPPTNNPFLMSHTLMGTLILLILLITDPPIPSPYRRRLK